jgi:hypothetical protein
MENKPFVIGAGLRGSVVRVWEKSASTFDEPVTNQELDQFYGREITQIDRNMAIGAAMSELDQDAYSDIAFEHWEAIADNIGNAEAIGRIIIAARKQWIADIASRALYGKAGMIKASEVNV